MDIFEGQEHEYSTSHGTDSAKSVLFWVEDFPSNKHYFKVAKIIILIVNTSIHYSVASAWIQLIGQLYMVKGTPLSP